MNYCMKDSSKGDGKIGGQVYSNLLNPSHHDSQG